MGGIYYLNSFVMEIEQREFHTKLLPSSSFGRNVHQHEKLSGAIVLECKWKALLAIVAKHGFTIRECGLLSVYMIRYYANPVKSFH